MQRQKIKALIEEQWPILKKTLIYCIGFFLFVFIINIFFADKYIKVLEKPLLLALRENTEIIYGNLMDPFIIKMNISLIAGFFLSIPFFLTCIYFFISPGLYKKEKIIFTFYIISSPLLFFFGNAFLYYLIFPNVVEFFLGVANKTNVKLLIDIKDYLSLIIRMIFTFGLAFQFPLILNLLLQLKIISIKNLKKVRRYVIVIIFILSAIFTPPDVLSQVSMAIPLILLYEIVIFLNSITAIR